VAEVAKSDAVDKEFLGVCATVRGLLATVSRGEVLGRHRIGEILRGVKRAPDTFGSHAIDRIAAELGLRAGALYEYIAVAEAWSRDDVVVELRKTDRFGRPLAWSHFVVLSKISDATRRAALLDECVVAAWSVRELKTRVAECASGGGRRARLGEPVTVALEEALRTTGRAVTELRVIDEALADRLDEPDAAMDTALIARVVASFVELRVHADAVLARLGRSGVSQVRLRVPSRAFPCDESADDEGDDTEAPLVEGARPKLRRVER
jgi:hypothetical protein